MCDLLGLAELQNYKLDIIVAESMDVFNKTSMTLPIKCYHFQCTGKKNKRWQGFWFYYNNIGI